ARRIDRPDDEPRAVGRVLDRGRDAADRPELEPVVARALVIAEVTAAAVPVGSVDARLTRPAGAEVLGVRRPRRERDLHRPAPLDGDGAGPGDAQRTPRREGGRPKGGRIGAADREGRAAREGGEE